MGEKGTQKKNGNKERRGVNKEEKEMATSGQHDKRTKMGTEEVRRNGGGGEA